jgi:hypothetical protein
MIKFAPAKKDKEEYFSRPIWNNPLYIIDYKRHITGVRFP